MLCPGKGLSLSVSKGPLNWDTVARGAVLHDCHPSLPRASQGCSNLQTLKMALKPQETSAQLCLRLAVCPEFSSEAGDSVGSVPDTVSKPVPQ